MIPLPPTALNGLARHFAGQVRASSAPLFFASAGQVIPGSVGACRRNSVCPPPPCLMAGPAARGPCELAPFAPAIFPLTVRVQTEARSRIRSEQPGGSHRHPAGAGRRFADYCTGLGLVGEPSLQRHPSSTRRSPRRSRSRPSSIGGWMLPVQFSGLMPGPSASIRLTFRCPPVPAPVHRFRWSSRSVARLPTRRPSRWE